MASAQHWPDGVEDRHAGPSGRLHALPIGIVVLSLVMVAGLIGLAGREATASASGSGAQLEWHAPTLIRNGEFFEIRIRLVTQRTISKPILGIDTAVWEDFTVNTFIPAAAEESSRDGEFRFAFDALEAGASMDIKVDAQINPDTLGPNAGRVTVYDGEEALITLPVHIEVLP